MREKKLLEQQLANNDLMEKLGGIKDMLVERDEKLKAKEETLKQRKNDIFFNIY